MPHFQSSLPPLPPSSSFSSGSTSEETEEINYYEVDQLNESVIYKGAAIMIELKENLKERLLSPFKEQAQIIFKEEIEPELIEQCEKRRLRITEEPEQSSFLWGFDLFNWIHSIWGIKEPVE